MEMEELLKQVKELGENVAKGMAARDEALAELKREIEAKSATAADVEAKLARITADVAKHFEALQGVEKTIDEMAKKAARRNPDPAADVEIKHARGLLELMHVTKHAKASLEVPFQPTDAEIEDAQLAVKALRRLMKHPLELATPGLDRLSDAERKALTSFAVGNNGFILQPELSSRILSCIEDETDIIGLFSSMTISGPSVKFLVDKDDQLRAAWACETNCFANNPKLELNLGELEIKPETLRFVACTTRDLIEDASVDIEAWIVRVVQRAFRRTIQDAVLMGDGAGKPLGLLNRRSGIQVCEVADATAPGAITWQDLVALKYQVPMQFHAGARYLMNQNTFGYLLTLSDAGGRPIMIASPREDGQLVLFGSPVNIVTQMPNIGAGNTPVGFGNWNEAYMIVNRKAVTMQIDPYSAGFCILYKFEARVGGNVICPLAARFLRTK